VQKMMGSKYLSPGVCCRSANYVDSQFSVDSGRAVWSAALEEMHVASPFGLPADAVAFVLVIGDAVHWGGWFVATMSCRRVTGRARR
jgi:hypothetical protein